MSRTIPPIDEIDRRLEACRQEASALKKLRRVALTIEQAERAKQARAVQYQGDQAGGRRAD
jgi:hypothetical protein